MHSYPESSSTSFDDALALRAVGDQRFDVTIAPGWDVRGTPHGGYLLALLGAGACQVAPQNDPVSIAANYLAPPSFGPAELWVEVVRAGRRQTTVAARLVQDGRERVRGTITVGTLDPSPSSTWGDDMVAPPIPPPDQCLAVGDFSQVSGEEAIALHRRVDLRLHPDTGWVVDKPSGTPTVEGWLRLANGRESDALALLLFSDGFPPSIFEATGRTSGHVPTMQLTTHLFGVPSSEWIQARVRTRVRGGGFIDEDGELWDANGRLVATTRQMALLR